MKYKVLLVDDESIFLKYMSKIIDWEKYGCEICGHAMDGEDAVEMVEKLRPDIVFMDIKMSNMDGLEASEKIKEGFNDIKIVIMTAYEEFSFAKKAIKLNVSDYLLKPFTLNELRDTLDKCISEIQKEMTNKEEKLFRALLENKNSHMNTENFYAQKKALVVLFPTMANISEQERENSHSTIISNMKERKIDTYFPGKKEEYGVIVHISDNENLSDTVVRELYKKMLENGMIESIPWVAIGKVVDKIENLQESYSYAKMVCENKIKMTGRVYSNTNMQRLKEEITIMRLEDVKELIVYFETGQNGKADKLLNDIFGFRGNNMLSFQYIIATYYSIITEIYNHYQYKEKQNLHKVQETMQAITNEIGLCSTGEQMLDVLKNYICEAVSDCIKEPVGNKKEILTWRIENYIQQHYMEKNFSVQNIVDTLHFENSYLRRIYKMQTGKTITQKLEEVRMEKAKQYLILKKYKQAEVSEMVGYCDQQYFSKRFRLYEGCTPSQYCKKMEKVEK